MNEVDLRALAEAGSALIDMRRSRSCCLIILMTGGCAPMIPHGPDVHDGFSTGISAAIGRGPTYENGDDPGPFYFGAALVSVAYGIRPASDARPALRLGLQGPVTSTLAVDIFAQAPRKWFGPINAGAGLLGDPTHGRQMPYVQAGVRNKAGYGLNGAIGRYRDRTLRPSYSVDERAQVNWLSLEVPVGRTATLHLHGGYAAGHVIKTSKNASTPYVDEDRWVRLGGATLELHR